MLHPQARALEGVGSDGSVLWELREEGLRKGASLSDTPIAAEGLGPISFDLPCFACQFAILLLNNLDTQFRATIGLSVRFSFFFSCFFFARDVSFVFFFHLAVWQIIFHFFSFFLFFGYI